MKTIQEIEEIIGVPANKWIGHCYSISCSLVEHGIFEGKAVFGKYYGIVDKGSFFAGKPHIQHGWIQTKDDQIIDPTRWVFENVEPYIYFSDTSNKEYDRGANLIKDAFRTPPPALNPTGKTFAITDPNISLILSVLLEGKFENNEAGIEQLLWCANRSIDELGDFTKPIYEFLLENGLDAFIPIDNKEMVLDW